MCDIACVVLVDGFVLTWRGECGMAGLQPRDAAYKKPRVPDELKWAPVMRGYPEGVEVLTELGWLSFEVLFSAGVNGWSGDAAHDGPLFSAEEKVADLHIPLREDRAANMSVHQQGYEYAHANQPDFTRWVVDPSRMVRVATLEPGVLNYMTGRDPKIVFERPTHAFRFHYDNHQLVHVKKRGVDLVVPRYTDVFTKARYQSMWDFTVADDFCVNRKVSSYRSVVNRYSPDGALYGDVDAGELVRLSEAGGLSALTSGHFPARVEYGEHVSRKRIWDVFESDGPKVRDEVSGRFVRSGPRRNSVECFNVVFAPGSSHTLIVRRERKMKGGARKGEWVGEPLVMGDGYDKSQIRVDKLTGLYR